MRIRYRILFLCVSVSLVGCDINVTKPVAPANISETKPTEVIPTAPLAPQLSSWLPEPSMESLLAAPEITEGFSIRPPAGYSTMVLPNAPTGLFAKVWKGGVRSDESLPIIQLNILSPPVTASIPDVETGLRKSMDSIKRNRNNWTESQVTRGTIQGTEFVRQSWAGIEKRFGAEMRGVMYVTMLDSKVIQLSTQDLEPHAEETIKLAESAIRTFAKAQQ